MDPKAAWQEMWAAFEDVRPEECQDHAQALRDWLGKDGFWPEGMTTPGGEEVGQVRARYWAGKMLKWADAFLNGPVDDRPGWAIPGKYSNAL